MPTTLAMSTGVVTGVPSRVTCKPAGLVRRAIVETFGRMSRVVVCERPAESVTVR
jgi:hypothetical protein